jgi:hypothetical protein
MPRRKKRARCTTHKSSANLEVVARPKYFSAIRSDVYQLKFSTRVQNVFISQWRGRARNSRHYMTCGKASGPLTLSSVALSLVSLTPRWSVPASERANGQIIQHHEREISFHAAATQQRYILCNWMKFGVKRKIGAKNTL